MNRIAASVAAALATPPAALYIAFERNRLAAKAREIAPEEKESLRPFFAPADLDRVRVHHADPLPVADVPFAAGLRHLGFSFPEVSRVEAITLDHVIAAREPMPLALLFHELVHVVQFRVLGLARFTWLYARGLLAGGSYDAIPLEQCAYEFEGRFRRGASGFSVEMEIREWLRDGRL